MRRIVAVSLAVLLAGCSSAPTDPPTEATPSPTPSVRGPAGEHAQEVADATSLFSDFATFEPTVAVGTDGTIYATSAWGYPFLAKRPDGTVESLPRPLPSVAPLLGAQPSDVMIQVGPDGRLYFHALLYHVENNAAYYAFMLMGLYVAVSDDGGRSWPTVTYIGLPDSEQLPQLGADRQWLTVAPDGTLYLVYQRVPAILSPRVGPVPVTQHYGLTDPGVMFSRSDDGGASWTEFRRISGGSGGVINGQPIVDAGGRLVVPFFEYGAQRALKVAVSGDRGASFALHEVYAADMPGQWFPSIARVGDGLVMAWVGPEDGLFTARSTDGLAWDAAQRVSPPNATVATSPWLLVQGDRVHVLWFQDVGDTSSSMWWSTLAEGAVEHRLVDDHVAGTASKRAMTDFAHGVLADGRLHAVWTDMDDPNLWYWEQPLI